MKREPRSEVNTGAILSRLYQVAISYEIVIIVMRTIPLLVLQSAVRIYVYMYVVGERFNVASALSCVSCILGGTMYSQKAGLIQF